MEPNVIVSSKVYFIKITFNGSNIQTIFDINNVYVCFWYLSTESMDNKILNMGFSDQKLK